MRTSRTSLVIGLLCAAVLGSVFAARTGSAAFATALEALTWRPVLLICVLQLGSVALCGLAWWILTQHATFLACTIARWVRDGVSSILGFLPGMGEFAGARMLKLLGARGGDAMASSVLDIVTEALSQVLFTVCGVLALLSIAGANMVAQAVGAILAAVPPALAIAAVSRSRRALDLLDRMISRIGRFLGFGSAASTLDIAANVGRLNRRSGALAGATILHLAAWCLGTAQVWVAAHAMGHPVSVGAALAIFSIGYAARGLLFFVPMGLGVQELSFGVVGAAFGLDETVATALSLTLRGRDLILGLPATLLWVVSEARDAGTLRNGMRAVAGNHDR